MIRRYITLHKPTATFLLPLLSVLFMLTGGSEYASAQVDAQLTQYWSMPTYYNSAYAGQIDYIRIRGAARMQWIGIERAPRSFQGVVDMPIKLNKKSRLGVGVNVMQESIGLFDNLFISAQAAYRFNALKGTFSIGVQPGYYNVKFRGTDVVIPEGDDYHQPTDEAIPTMDVVGNAFDLGVGVSYHHKYFSVGVSCLHLLEPTVDLDKETAAETETAQYSTTLPRQLYFMADGNIPLKNSLFSLQPSMLLRTDFVNFSADVTMRATWNNFLSFGLGYRYNDGVSAMIGAEFKNVFLGYAYEYPTSAIARASSGSHEITIGYKVKLNLGEKNKNKHRSIRIM